MTGPRCDCHRLRECPLIIENHEPATRGRRIEESPVRNGGAGRADRRGLREDHILAHQDVLDDGPYDLVIGINTKDVHNTIIHVLNVVCEGLQAHFPAMKSLVVVCDGASTDDTVALANFFPTPRGIRKIVVQQNGGPGKGNGIRTILDIANRVDAHACAFVDGDLVSIRPIWVDNLLRPILHGLTDLTVPYYLRDKWDGVITNHLCYPLTAALYGSSVRQPIGGDYGLSRDFYRHLLEQDDMPPHFGIDIFITTSAIAEGYRTMEAPLGIKVHASTTGYTDPRKTLSRMYLEVVGTLLSEVAKYEDHWRAPAYKAPILLSENVVSYYDRFPAPTTINEDTIHEIFVEGADQYGEVLKAVLPQDLWLKLEASLEGGLEATDWARMVYAIAAWVIVEPDGIDRESLLHALGALGMGRFLHFVHETKASDLQGAHVLIQDQAHTFQRLRPEFIRRVDALRKAVSKRESAKAIVN